VTDAATRLTRVRRSRLSAWSINTLSRPRLSQAIDVGSRASDASDAVGANAMNSNGQTRGDRRSDRRYCAAFVAPENCPVRSLTALFDRGLINTCWPTQGSLLALFDILVTL
jgi:hypothetical protein